MFIQVWVTRGNEDIYVDIWPSEIKPNRDNDNGDIYYTLDKTDAIACLTIKNFKKMFGYTPKKGTCKQVTFSIKVENYSNTFYAR